MTVSGSSAALATSRNESAAFLSAGRNQLVALRTAPVSAANGLGVVLLHGGGYRWSAHRNQLFTRIARRLAALGFYVVRFDYHGIGDSTGKADEFRMDRPFVEDTLAAVEWLRDSGVCQYLVVGECFGARTALAAVGEIDELAGLFLIAPPMRDGRQSEAPLKLARRYGAGKYLRHGFTLKALRRLRDPVARRAFRRLARAKLDHLTRAFRPQAAGTVGPDVSETMLNCMAGAVARGVNIQFVFGTRDGADNFDAARGGRLGEILSAGGDAIGIAVLEGRVHAELTRVDTQDAIYGMVAEWAGTLAVA